MVSKLWLGLLCPTWPLVKHAFLATKCKPKSASGRKRRSTSLTLSYLCQSLFLPQTCLVYLCIMLVDRRVKTLVAFCLNKLMFKLHLVTLGSDNQINSDPLYLVNLLYVVHFIYLKHCRFSFLAYNFII